jgi:hypothetical protein
MKFQGQKTCPQISKRQTGKKNHMYGKSINRKRKVKCLNDNKIYDSVKKTFQSYPIARNSLLLILNGAKNDVEEYGFEYA